MPKYWMVISLTFLEVPEVFLVRFEEEVLPAKGFDAQGKLIRE